MQSKGNSSILRIRSRQLGEGTIRQISELVMSCLRSMNDGEPEEVELLHVRANALLFRCRISGQCLAMKYCRAGDALNADPEGAANEYRALERISEAKRDRDEEPRTPAPVRLYAGTGVYAMTWCDGVPMTSALLRAGSSFRRRRALSQGAAMWLKQLHALRSCGHRKLEIEAKLEYVRRFRESCDPRDPVVLEGARLLLDKAGVVSAQPIPVSWIHGDFKADNLLVDGSAIAGLDCHLRVENTIVHDLATFLNHLASLRWYFPGALYALQLRTLIDEFPALYDERAHAWKPSLDWLRAYMLLQRFDGPPSGSLAARFGTISYRAQLRSISACLRRL